MNNICIYSFPSSLIFLAAVFICSLKNKKKEKLVTGDKLPLLMSFKVLNRGDIRRLV